MFKIIACINKKLTIGNEGKLLYRLPSDIKNFARMTKFNGVIIMGRKTFESLPNGEPLKDRINIILTTDPEYCVDNVENVFIANSIQDAIDLCETMFSDKDWFVIGGESIYKQFLEKGVVDEMLLTIVNDEADGDSHFPEFNETDWYEYYKSMVQVGSCDGVDRSFYFKILKKKI